MQKLAENFTSTPRTAKPNPYLVSPAIQAQDTGGISKIAHPAGFNRLIYSKSINTPPR